MWVYDYWVWMMLNAQFMGPAKMMARTGAMEDLMKQFKIPTICKS